MTSVAIRLRDPGKKLPDGRAVIIPGALDWHLFDYVRQDLCDHEATVCRLCLEVWEIDHEVQLDTIADLYGLGVEDPDDDPDEDDGDLDLFEQTGYAAGPFWDHGWDADE